MQLVVRATPYYSTNDEVSFFSWLKKIPCVENCRGDGIDLFINLNDTVDDESLHDTKAILVCVIQTY
jgi:hypothetical protein